MSQVWDFFRKLFDTADFPPRWHCGKWTEFHGWFYIISDLLIWSAYFAIPLIIIRYITKKRQEARFVRLYFLFASFILACGSTHFLDAITFWLPVYRLNALVRFMTGVVSWVTVFSLIKILPEAFNLKTAAELEAEVNQREFAEKQLKINNAILNEAQEIAKIGYWQWDIRANRIRWSKTMKRIYGLRKDEELTYEGFIEYIHPDDRAHVQETIKTAFAQRYFPEFYHRIILANGIIKTLHAKGEVIIENGEVVQMIGTGQDVTAQKKVEQELLQKSQELENTNLELQKFASVASHDLREPLRKIMTFSTLLEKEYTDNIGEKGRMYINKINTASARMQRLIDDILDFSNLSDRKYDFTKVNLNQVIDNVLSDIEILVESNNAAIKVDPLPEIEGLQGQLSRLFQNLISNAIKFRTDTPPSIHIYSETIKGSQLPESYISRPEYRFSVINSREYWETERFCKIYIEDNGIGFDEAYLDKIFLIFQRLHSKTEYEGTGIGLAVCKKIMDLHHGFITATSRQGSGATFIIILPLSQRSFENVKPDNVVTR